MCTHCGSRERFYCEIFSKNSRLCGIIQQKPVLAETETLCDEDYYTVKSLKSKLPAYLRN